MKNKLRSFLVRKLGTPLINLKWRYFGFYYEGLAIQAQYLYRQSERYKTRWQLLGREYAEKEFGEFDMKYFYRLAKKEPFLIKLNILMDGLLGRERQGYYINSRG